MIGFFKGKFLFKLLLYFKDILIHFKIFNYVICLEERYSLSDLQQRLTKIISLQKH